MRIVYPILVHAQSPYDVEIARHDHLANYAFHDATEHVLVGLESFSPLRPAVPLSPVNLASGVALALALSLRHSKLCARLASIPRDAKEAR